jgi:hypothetical protein
MKPDIQVQIRNLPREILSDFEKSIDKTIALEIYEDTNDHFEPPADIVIYINEHLTDIIVGGVGVGLLTNAFWDGLKALWKRVINRKKENSIELNFTINPDKEIEFDLIVNIDPKNIDAITEKILNYLKDKEQQQKDFANPDFKDKHDVKPRIRVRYNPKTERMEIVNFTELRKRDEELLKRIIRP